MDEVSLKVGNEISFDERSEFLLEERVSKEEWNGDKDLNEEGMKSMSFEKDWNTFLETFLLKIVSMLMSLFL